MILCVCNAVTDREVDDVIRRGASSVDAVTQMCGAGGDCGACCEAIEGRISCSASAPRTLARTPSRAPAIAGQTSPR